VALSRELPERGAPLPVRLLGEDLVLFLDDVKAGRDPRHVVREAAHNRFPHLQVISEVLPAAVDPKAYIKANMLKAASADASPHDRGRPAAGEARSET
jgi:hypothetical protein